MLLWGRNCALLLSRRLLKIRKLSFRPPPPHNNNKKKKSQMITLNSSRSHIISWGLLNYSNKTLVSLWASFQPIFAETKEQFLCSCSFACRRSQKQHQREASASFPRLPLVQREGDGEELRDRKVSYWKVWKHQELKTGQQVFTLHSQGCLLEEFLRSSSYLIWSNCASGSKSAAYLVADSSAKI